MHCTSRFFSPALEDRRVGAEDLKLAVKLAIAPRGIFMQQPPDDDEEMLVSVFCFHRASAPGTMRASRGVVECTLHAFFAPVFVFVCYRVACRVWRWVALSGNRRHGWEVHQEKIESRAIPNNRAQWQQNSFISSCFFGQCMRVNILFFSSLSAIPSSPPFLLPLSGFECGASRDQSMCVSPGTFLALRCRASSLG